IDPTQIPISLESDFEKGKEICKTKSSESSEFSAALKKLSFQKEAADLKYKMADRLLAPELTLGLNYNSNGVDSDNNPLGNQASLSKSFNEARGFEHPSFAVEVLLNFPLGFSEEKANLAEAASEKMKL